MNFPANYRLIAKEKKKNQFSEPLTTQVKIGFTELGKKKKNSRLINNT